MALKGLDIFKLSPKTNCKECGCPTCMAFSMKVAQGALSLDKCPHMSAEALSKLSAATEPPMKTISVGEHKLGGETVMLRHEKTLVNRNLYGIFLCANMDDAEIDRRIAESMAVDYERIGERMFVEVIYVNAPAEQSPERCADLAKKAAATGRDLVIEAADADRAKAALEAAGDAAKVLAGANAANWEAFNALAAGKLVLGVKGADLSEIHDTVEKLEGAGNKNLIIDVTGASIKEAFANAMQVRRAALKGGDRTFGYPSIVNTARLARGDSHMQAALASMFTLRYGSIVVLDSMSYAILVIAVSNISCSLLDRLFCITGSTGNACKKHHAEVVVAVAAAKQLFLRAPYPMQQFLQGNGFVHAFRHDFEQKALASAYA